MVLGIDLGGTKITGALFTLEGRQLDRKTVALNGRAGSEVGALLVEMALEFIHSAKPENLQSIAVSVPGINRMKTGTVWAPNIPGWDDYPLLAELKAAIGEIPVSIDSDRACYILGEAWQGSAKGCSDAIYLAVGTGIGAGILINGEVLRGAHDIAGAIGWLALTPDFDPKYLSCGCFEHHASGEGIAKVAKEKVSADKGYSGVLKSGVFTSHDVFKAYDSGDPIANEVVEECIRFWGMAVANLVSLFNPEKIILGGGVFGPAGFCLPRIKEEATKWAQPISQKLVELELSALGTDAGVFGAGFLALRNIAKP